MNARRVGQSVSSAIAACLGIFITYLIYVFIYGEWFAVKVEIIRP